MDNQNWLKLCQSQLCSVNHLSWQHQLSQMLCTAACKVVSCQSSLVQYQTAPCRILSVPCQCERRVWMLLYVRKMKSTFWAVTCARTLHGCSTPLTNVKYKRNSVNSGNQTLPDRLLILIPDCCAESRKGVGHFGAHNAFKFGVISNLHGHDYTKNISVNKWAAIQQYIF